MGRGGEGEGKVIGVYWCTREYDNTRRDERWHDRREGRGGDIFVALLLGYPLFQMLGIPSHFSLLFLEILLEGYTFL